MKQKVKKIICELVYQLYKHHILKNKLQVESIDNTIDRLINSDLSLVRFGDAEIRMIEGNTTKFQDYDEELSRRLYEILQYKQEKVMVGIPDIFGSLEQYTEKSRDFWKEHLFFSRKTYLKYCNTEKTYENAFFSRLYYIYQDKEQSGIWFDKVKEIWRDRDIVVVEGEGTHTGAGNDLLALAASIERVLCPGLNAYLAYPEIREACLSFSKEKLFLFAVGNTAKLLITDMVKEGYRAIDIGNLDMEYEWYLSSAVGKEEIRKHSIVGKESNLQAGYEEYWSQVKNIITL